MESNFFTNKDPHASSNGDNIKKINIYGNNTSLCNQYGHTHKASLSRGNSDFFLKIKSHGLLQGELIATL